MSTEGQTMPLKDARIAFGRALAIWRNQNQFSQNDIEAIGKALNLPIHNSQQSNVENAVSEPKGKYWIAFEGLNRAIEQQQILDLPDAVKEKFRRAKPFLNADGTVAIAQQLWAMAFGQAPLPADFASDQTSAFTEADAININAVTREIFAGYAAHLGLSKKKAFKDYASNLPDVLSSSELEAIRDMLFDLEDMEPKTMEKILKKSVGSDCPIHQAFKAWTQPHLSLPSYSEVRASGASMTYQELVATRSNQMG